MLSIFKKTIVIKKSCISVNELKLEIEKILLVVIAHDCGK